jgi:redox-sensitive bicupin YhaK (pirin superfamily)
MIQLRAAEGIHRSEGGWYSARWHFSFGSYRDPEQMGFGALRVFNDDRLIPGAVWPMHPHRDIEGITYVVEGTFEHADSLGNGGVLLPGAVQRATLGSGMQHSERNGSQDQPTRFLQFWILPDAADLPPSVEQQQFTREQRTDRLLRVVAPMQRVEAGEVGVHQDASVFATHLTPGQRVAHETGEGRGAYLYVIDGRATLNGEPIRTGDAAKVFEGESIEIEAEAPSELILVDVPLRYEPVGIWAR